MRNVKSHLSDVVLQQLQDKQTVSSVLDCGVAAHDVVAGLAVGVEDEALPLDGSVVVAALPETLESHDGAISDSHSLVDHTAPPSSHLDTDNLLQIAF